MAYPSIYKHATTSIENLNWLYFNTNLRKKIPGWILSSLTSDYFYTFLSYSFISFHPWLLDGGPTSTSSYLSSSYSFSILFSILYFIYFRRFELTQNITLNLPSQYSGIWVISYRPKFWVSHACFLYNLSFMSVST